MKKKAVLTIYLTVALSLSVSTAYAMPVCLPAGGSAVILSVAPGPSACCPIACHCTIKTPAPARDLAVLVSRIADGVPALLIGLSTASFFPPPARVVPHVRPTTCHSPPGVSLLDLYSVYRV